MRRDLDLVREILKAVGANDCSDTDQLAERLKGYGGHGLIDYHLMLLVYEAHLLHGKRVTGSAIGGPDPLKTLPGWTDLTLTWTGNDFLDAIDNDKAWSRIKKVMEKGGATLGTEALKTAAKTLVPIGIGILAAQEGERFVAKKGSRHSGGAEDDLS